MFLFPLKDQHLVVSSEGLLVRNLDVVFFLLTFVTMDKVFGFSLKIQLIYIYEGFTSCHELIILTAYIVKSTY